VVGYSEETTDSDSVEIAFWQSVQSSDKEPEYELYLERYPDGAFAELAKARLQNAKAADDPSIELAYWETVRESGEAEMLKAYLEKYPQGQFISLASIMLDKLEKATG
jgi:adenylate cyclase